MTETHDESTAAMITTAGLISQLRGPASHVVVDVVDPGVGGATPVRQAMTGLGARPEKPSTPPALLLSAGIVVAATVVSAGIVNLTPAIVAFVFAGAVALWLRVDVRRSRRTDESTRWASRTGQAFGAWEPGVPTGRRRLLVDHRGLAVVDLGAHREPLAVLLWKHVNRLILVPGSERKTDPGLVVHRTDGRIALFTTSFSLHEVMPALDEVGVPTDIEQAMAGATSVRRRLAPVATAAEADPWANVAPGLAPAAAPAAPAPGSPVLGPAGPWPVSGAAPPPSSPAPPAAASPAAATATDPWSDRRDPDTDDPPTAALAPAAVEPWPDATPADLPPARPALFGAVPADAPAAAAVPPWPETTPADPPPTGPALFAGFPAVESATAGEPWPPESGPAADPWPEPPTAPTLEPF